METKQSQVVEIFHPTINVEFYGEYGKLASIGVKDFTQDKNVAKDIISVNTIRNMGQDCPTFSLKLVYRNNWYQTLSSNDLVIIKMQRPPETKKTVFFGLVDDIRKVMDFSSGSPQIAVQVTGRGFNKALVNFDVGLIKGWSIDTGTGFFAELSTIDGTDSAEAIRIVLKSYIENEVLTYKFGSGQKSFKSYYQYDASSRPNERLIDYRVYTSFNGSMWNFIKELGNAPFDETFWEVQNEKPTLKHRRTPFNKEDWNALHLDKIPDSDIVSDSTGRTDLETYTLFSVLNPNMDDTLSGNTLYPPLWYPAFHDKYGITQLQVDSPYMDYLDYAAVDSYQQDLFNFNIKNNVFANGTIDVKGKALYKIGQRVLVESDNMEYYVESVTHNFNCYTSWTTSLGVTRGITPDKRFTAPWGCAEEFSAAIMSAIVEQTGGGVTWSDNPVINSDAYSGAGGNGNGNYPVSYSSVGGTTTENEIAVYNILKSWGLNTAAAAGVLANINAESGFKTEVWGDNHTSLGLCQWHNSRCTALQTYCRNNGYNVTSVEGQMAYLKTELMSSYSSTWNKFNSVPNTEQGAYEAAEYWCIHFEVPKYKEEKGRERGGTARDVYFPKYINGAPSTEGGTVTGSGDGTWLGAVQTVKRMLASLGVGYSQTSYVTYKFDGFQTKVHPDCSGTVTAMLSLLWGRSVSQIGSSDFTSRRSLDGFTKLRFTSWNDLQQGDIICLNGHVEVFSHNSGGTHYVWNAGGNTSVKSANPTVSGHSSYTTVWRKT